MKLLVLCALCVSALSLSASQEQPTRDELRQTLDHMLDLSRDQQNELNAEREAHKQTNSQLSAALEAKRELEGQISTMSHNSADCFADRDHLLGKLHLAKWILCAAVSAAIVFGALHLPPPLNFYVGGSALVIANTLVWALV